MNASHPLHKSFRTQWWTAAGFLCLIAVLLIYNLITSRVATDRLEQLHLQNLNQITTDILTRRLRAADGLMTLVESELAEGFPAGEARNKLTQLMAQLAKLGNGTSILMVLGPTGDVITANRDELQGKNFAHRYYFSQAIAAVDSSKRIISPPFETVLGELTFTISRQIIDRQGRLLGVVMATIDMPYIGKLLIGTLYAQDMWASLTHGNGVQVLNTTRLAEGAGRDMNQAGSFFMQHQAKPESTNLVIDSTLGLGGPQLVAVSTVQPQQLNMDYGLVVAIGRNADAIFADWYRQALQFFGLYLALVALALVGLHIYQKRTAVSWRKIFRQQALIESTSDGICILDIEGRLVEANPAFLKMLGLNRSAVGQITADSFDVHRDSQQIIEIIQRLSCSKESLTLETRHRCLDGREIDVEINCHCFEDDGTTFLIASSRDITARKRTEDQIRKLSLAVEQSPESIFITDASGLIEYANAALLQTSGYSWAELQGQNPGMLASGKTPAETIEAMKSTLAQGNTWRGEFINRRKNGKCYVESEIISPIRQEDGQITHFLAIKQDVTEKKEFEVELEAYRSHLERLVAERTAELTAANQALEQANLVAATATRSKAAFLANMSHEIRTPMNGILGMLHILRRSGVSPKQEDCLDKVASSARHLLSLINDILDLSKIDAGKMIIEQEPVAIERIPVNVASIIAPNASSKGLQVHIETAALPGALLGDVTRITQALLNLASNAVKFTQQGQVVLRTLIEAENAAEIWLRFEVEDTGIGIAPENLARLFTAFEQAENSTTRQYGGTGLGLAITLNMARLMGGDAGARSTLGVGSVFWFSVHLKKGTAPLPMEEHHPQGQSEKILQRDFLGSRILLVEDEPINQEITALLLEEAGMVVEIADNGQIAVSKAKNSYFALILMDMQMPVMDGLEASQQIRKLPGYKQTPIIAMTANAFVEDRLRCTEAGMDDFIGKPAEPENLFRILLHWLERKQLR